MNTIADTEYLNHILTSDTLEGQNFRQLVRGFYAEITSVDDEEEDEDDWEDAALFSPWDREAYSPEKALALIQSGTEEGQRYLQYLLSCEFMLLETFCFGEDICKRYYPQ